TRDIKRILGSLKMIDDGLVPRQGWKDYQTEYYEVYNVLKREEGDVLKASVQNFVIVKEGDHIVTNSKGVKILADKDFYPILFGENRYKDIFGFLGNRV
ncbi:MAG: hypothetical protein LR008_03395, partial [Candidatus Pacebacteria bacterium]|nr:hypothetical protein [Candidatus Paceibacterota bacterium]